MALKKYPTSKIFRSELEKKKLHPVYLFMGEEEGEKDKFIQKILQLVFPDTGEIRNSTGRFHIELDEFMGAADFVLSSSMFSSSKVCIMHNMESLKNPKSHHSLLQEIMDNRPDGTTIIMTTMKNRPPDFFTQKQLEKMMIVQFWKYFDSDIYNYIMAFLQKNGFSINERGMNLLIELTGKDIKKIDEALEMIRFSGLDKMITEETVKNLLHDVSETSVFDFTELLFKKDRKALLLFRKLMDDGVPEGRIFFEISKQFDALEKYYSLTGGGTPVEEALEQCGISQKGREKFMAYTRAFSGESLKRLYPILARTDFRRKSTQVSKEITATPVFGLISEMVSNHR